MRRPGKGRRRGGRQPSLVLAAVLLLLGVGGAASASGGCEAWYRRSGAVPGTPECVVRCMGAPVGMGDFACPPGCREWCARSGAGVPFGPQERAALRRVLGTLYGPGRVAAWEMRPEMLGLLATLLVRSGKCAVVTALLPAPPAVPPGPAWLARQLGRLARGLAAASPHRLACIRVAALALRFDFELLGRGW